MIWPFGLRDVLPVQSLQRDGVWLDLFHYLLLRRNPLATALIAPVPWVGTGLASYVWRQRNRLRALCRCSSGQDATRRSAVYRTTHPTVASARRPGNSCWLLYRRGRRTRDAAAVRQPA